MYVFVCVCVSVSVRHTLTEHSQRTRQCVEVPELWTLHPDYGERHVKHNFPESQIS